MTEYAIDHGGLSVIDGQPPVEGQLTKPYLETRITTNNRTISFLEAQLKTLREDNVVFETLLQRLDNNGS